MSIRIQETCIREAGHAKTEQHVQHTWSYDFRKQTVHRAKQFTHPAPSVKALSM